MKSKVIVTVALALMIGLSSIYAQQKSNEEDRSAKHIEKLTELLDLTDNQKSQMEILFTEFHDEIKNIREDEEKPWEDKREAMGLQHESHMKELEKILTEDQLETFKEHQAEMRQNERKGKGKYSQKMDDDTKALILERRIEFDSELSDDEKETIAALRLQRETWRNERNPGQEECLDRESRQAIREEHKSKTEPLFEIVENHKNSIMTIHEELREELDFPGHGKMDRGRHFFAKHEMAPENFKEMHFTRHSIHFLLLNPDEKDFSEEYSQIINETLNIYPNPVSSSFSVGFEMQNDGIVTIELLNKYGGLLEVLNKSSYKAGYNSFTCDVNSLAPAEVYFVRVSKPDIVLVEKFIKL